MGINLPASITGDPNIQAVTWQAAHYPTNNVGDIELWVLGQHLTSTNNVLTHNVKGVWTTITPTLDALVTTGVNGSRLRGASLHGKFYIAYNSAQDRLHVWDGTNFRRCGMAAPAAAPTAADSGGGGTLSGTRYYRVRYTVMSGATVVVRSEPSPVLTFTPSGSNASITITKPATVGESETNWELEASTDNANFYRIATTVVGTSTVVDTVQTVATGYAASGPLSENLTAYTLIPSGKYLTVDSDRLVIGGSWTTSAYGSRLWWTPVLGATGVGNDERLDMTVNPYLDLDGFEGGDLTGLSTAINGYFYAFKFNHIYKVIRTGQLTNAYTAIPISKSIGAFPGSVVEGVDQNGSAAIYFIDPTRGPMRIGVNGLEWMGRDLRNTWLSVNRNASIAAHGVFYSLKNQVHFWIAVNGSDHPNFKIVVHCNQVQSTIEGARRGWVTVPVGNRISDAYCSTMFAANVDSTDSRDIVLVPFIGKAQWSVNGSTIKNLVQRCDVGNTDAATVGDTLSTYYGKVQTKPFMPFQNQLSYFGLKSAHIVMGVPNNDANNVYVEISKDFGRETKLISIDIGQSQNAETKLIRKIDNLSMATMRTVQFVFGDLNTILTPATDWQIELFIAKVVDEAA